MPHKPSSAVSFDALYPAVAKWTKGGGWIEVGYDDYSRSFIRVLDIGGMIWEGKTRYRSVDAALRAAEKAVSRWYAENEG